MNRTDAPQAAQPLRLWRSAGLRLAALFGFLVLLTMLTTLALVYLQVSTVLHRNLERQLQQAQQRLALQYAHEGPQATAQAIGHMLQDGRDTDLELVLLTTPDGRFLAGNLAVQALPPLALIGASAHPVALGSQGITAQLLAHRLPDGAMLVLGHDLRELCDIESTLATASLIAGLFALSLALVSTWFFRRELGRSVDALHQTMARIAGGQLHERVPAQAARDDEFARLEQDFNHMLDRIEQLMAGVTHVSDAIAHNLRTPLTRLRLRLQHAHDGAADAAALRAALGSAMHDIDDLSRVLDKLLSIAQAESGTRRAPFTPQSWGEIGADVVELYEDLAEHEGVTLTWECTHPAPLLGDRSPKARAELHARLTPPLLALAFAMMTLPLGRSSPRQARYGRMMLGFLAYIVGTNLMFIGANAIAKGSIPPFLGLWWLSLPLLAAALWFYFNDGRMKAGKLKA